jgi:hypothetical protein
MNWEAASAISEIIGALAVVLSVIYLSFQIKKQTEESRLAATRELSAQTQGLMEVLLANPELIARYGKAVQMYKDLPNEERLWATMLFQRMFRAMEQQLMHSKNSHIEKVYFESVERTILEMLTLPGVQQWWENSNYMFSEMLRDYINPQLEVAKEKGYNSSFKNPKETD